MPRIAISVGLSLHCAVGDYLWPWRRVAPVLLLSGDKSRIASEQQKILADRLPNGRLALWHCLAGMGMVRAALDFWHEVEATSA
jgi:hypothetical protein